MLAPTYDLQPAAISRDRARRDVGRLADEVLRAGAALDPIRSRYARHLEAIGLGGRPEAELLLDLLALGVLWRARGDEATRISGARLRLMEALAAGRRAGGPRVRDGSPCLILSLDAPPEPGHALPTLAEVDRLFTWLLASGEYDDALGRLEPLRAFLAAAPDLAPGWLEDLVAFAVAFEAWGEWALGSYTSRVDRFLRDELPRRRWREDTVQCARRTVEYHLDLLGAELLNRAWRDDFLACERHVVVMPACARSRCDGECRALRSEHDLRCTRCTAGCAVRAATAVAEAAGAEAVAVVHGSDFSRFLRSPALASRGGGRVGIVGVACAANLLAAGWRARAAGHPAQCVVLDRSGCGHWLDQPRPTSLDLRELARILDRSQASSAARWAPHLRVVA
jgi:hypothetical protein